MRKVTLKFRLALFLARRGFFKYEGYDAFRNREWIMAQVHYPMQWWQVLLGSSSFSDCYSVKMAIGNAVEYAEMFGGTVVPLENK